MIKFDKTVQLTVAADYRLAMLEAIVERYKLREIYDYIRQPHFDTNQPYHNTGHCIRVALRGYELMAAAGWRLHHDYARMLVAAFFHDFGHTGKRPDSRNIEIAIAGLYGADCVKEYFKPDGVAYIADCIRCTEYNNGFPIAPKDIVQMALRDADLMESLEPNGIEYTLFNLCAELGIDDVKAAIPQQIAFMENAELFTDAGRYIWAATLDSRIAAVETLVRE
ncbi:hypothetical protein D3C80_878020 [compost metagenome]